jgi:drug/metabolite transporter (DMT)-like permease
VTVSRSPTRHVESQAVLYLISVVLMISSFAPSTKYVFHHSDLIPLDLACVRVLIGFLFLVLITLCWDRTGLFFLSRRDIWKLTLLGFLGVGLAYAVSAWSLLHTSVTHYVLIYCLTPSFTALFSFAMGRDRASALKVFGIAVSVAGCLIAITEGWEGFLSGFGFGDGLVLLFTVMMSGYIVVSAGIVKRYGAMTANTVMFGTSSVLLLLSTLLWGEPPHEHLSLVTLSLIVYIGVTTAAVFLLRYLSLQSLTPVTVGAFHNLVPVCTIVLAYLFLGEAVEAHTIIGGTTILAGVEMVRRA